MRTLVRTTPEVDGYRVWVQGGLSPGVFPPGIDTSRAFTVSVPAEDAADARDYLGSGLGSVVQAAFAGVARQYYDGVCCRTQEGPRHPTVTVRHIAERGFAPRDAGQVFQVTRDRQEEQVDATLQHAHVHLGPAPRVVEHGLIVGV